jgi:hypothetical protein
MIEMSGEIVCKLAKKLLNNRASVSFDLWSSKKKRSYIGVNVHYICHDKGESTFCVFRSSYILLLVVVTRTIDIHEVVYPHTAEVIRNSVLESIGKISLPMSNIIRFVADAASNNRCAFKKEFSNIGRRKLVILYLAMIYFFFFSDYE